MSNTIAQIGNILESIGLFTPGRDQLQVQQGYSDAGSYDKDATRERHSKDPEIIPAIDLDPYIPNRDYAEYYINVVKRTVRREESFVRQVFYTALSKDSDNPLNLGVLATTSWGKTYGIIQTLQYLQDKSIWYIGSMSPKVIIRQHGVLVDGNNQPLKPRLLELKRLIKDNEESENKLEVERLKGETGRAKQQLKSLSTSKASVWYFWSHHIQKLGIS